jgi:nucleotide-binding universal stress UspA family protein
MLTLKKVLVATDFSEPSNTALEYGRALARTFGASLEVLHVIQSPLAYSAGSEMMPTDPAYVSLQQELEAAARTTLDATVREDDRRELGARTTLLTASGVATAIVSHAKDCGADIIVIGTHGRSGLTHLLMGSVAEKVVRLAPCPVLTVRHPERDFLRPDALAAPARTAV